MLLRSLQAFAIALLVMIPLQSAERTVDEVELQTPKSQEGSTEKRWGVLYADPEKKQQDAHIFNIVYLSGVDREIVGFDDDQKEKRSFLNARIDRLRGITEEELALLKQKRRGQKHLLGGSSVLTCSSGILAAIFHSPVCLGISLGSCVVTAGGCLYTQVRDDVIVYAGSENLHHLTGNRYVGFVKKGLSIVGPWLRQPDINERQTSGDNARLSISRTRQLLEVAYNDATSEKRAASNTYFIADYDQYCRVISGIGTKVVEEIED